MTTLDLGKIRFTFKGDWDDTTVYSYNDVVQYGSHLYVYIGASASAATVPAVASATWKIMLRGLRNRGAWSSVATYLPGELAILGARVYQATATNTNSKPPTANWALLVEGTNFRGAYDNAAIYVPRDVVAFGAALFINKLECTGVATSNTTNWDPYLSAGDKYVGSSTSSLLVATGTKIFTGVNPQLSYTVGQRLRAASVSGPTNYMEGHVVSFTGGTLTLNVDLIGGSGTHADWSINIAGQPGLNGTAGRILGSVTLVAGSATINNALVDSDSVVFHSRQASGGTAGTISVTLNVGVGFTLTSSSGTDTSVIAWELIP